MTDLKLPELPVSPHVIGGCTGPEPSDWRTWTAYTEAHMQAYATAAVLAERAAAEADARRCRWLRDDPPLNLAVHKVSEFGEFIYIDGGNLDAAIDATMNAGGDDDAR